jgi:hypothetical protein
MKKTKFVSIGLIKQKIIHLISLITTVRNIQGRITIYMIIHYIRPI